MPTAAIILAAGASTRLGTPKQLVLYEGEILLTRAIRIAHAAGLSPILAVLGAHSSEILSQTDLHPAIAIPNPDWHQGMATSIHVAVQALGGNPDGAVLMVCDQPSVTPAHLRALVATDITTASTYAGRNGVPAFFPASALHELLTLQGDAGARAILQNAPAILLPKGEVDIDTPADLRRALEALSSPDGVRSLRK